MNLSFIRFLCVLACCSPLFSQTPVQPRVETEEEVYRYTAADNGAGPMWCHGNTCIVRCNDTVFASGLETIAGAKPLHNCLPLLFARGPAGWKQVYKATERTREPCPLGIFDGGKILLSVNPTLTQPDAYSGPARPEILCFASSQPDKKPEVYRPGWKGTPAFTEHSYRSFAVCRKRNELILFQNIGYDHAEWAFRDAKGNWPAQGKLVWPWGAGYAKPRRIRTCYPAVALDRRAVYFCGVSDIIEPNPEWRAYKKKLTGRNWDYDFRRLFFTWCDDIATGTFHDWIEIASREKTCGWIFPQDLAVLGKGRVLVLWTERALDERLRKRFFPDAKQRYSLVLALIDRGKVIARRRLADGGEGKGGERPGDGRFHTTSDGALYVIYHVSGADTNGTPLNENRLCRVSEKGVPGKTVKIQLKQPFRTFFTNTARAGCAPSSVIDLLGTVGTAVRYARIRIE